MSRITHDNPNAERVALFVHWLGFAGSAVTLAFGIGGVFWHLWAVKEHKKALKDLELWDSET